MQLGVRPCALSNRQQQHLFYIALPCGKFLTCSSSFAFLFVFFRFVLCLSFAELKEVKTTIVCRDSTQTKLILKCPNTIDSQLILLVNKILLQQKRNCRLLVLTLISQFMNNKVKLKIQTI
jgi:hypothetical protein